jgi:AraC-like DNA-binding protein
MAVARPPTRTDGANGPALRLEVNALSRPDDRAAAAAAAAARHRRGGLGVRMALITVVHRSALVSAGLASTLGLWPEFDVRVGSEDLVVMPLPPDAGVHIVLGDVHGLERMLAQELPPGTGTETTKPKVLLLVDSLHAGPTGPVGSVTVDARLSVDCRPEELHLALCGLCGPLTSRRAKSRQPSSARGGLAPGALRRVHAHIHSRLSQRIELSELADIAGLSGCHFSRAFKQSLGVPPHRYLMQRRIEAAAELIEQTDRPMSEIALEVGFSDQSHFTRMFSRHFLQTPRQFRFAHR